MLTGFGAAAQQPPIVVVLPPPADEIEEIVDETVRELLKRHEAGDEALDEETSAQS